MPEQRKCYIYIDEGKMGGYKDGEMTEKPQLSFLELNISLAAYVENTKMHIITDKL
jgi:hypothetical protein